MDSEASEQLYDLFLLGLSWLREENPDRLDRLGSSVIASFVKGGILPASAQSLVEQSFDLMELVEQRSRIVPRPKGKVLAKLARETKENSLVVIEPGHDFAQEKLLAPGGYRHVITNAGMEVARTIAGRYSQLATPKKFLRGWGIYKAQMRALGAQQAGSATQTQGQTAVDFSGSIPKAPRQESDFDW